MKKCLQCKKSKREKYFNFKNRRTGLRHSYCKSCQSFYSMKHYRKNKKRFLKNTIIRNKENRLENNKRIFEYLSHHPCVKCEEDDPIVLDFHHRDKKQKKGAVSRLKQNYNWKIVKKEIGKCDVLCANCHRRKTAAEQGWYKSSRKLS